MRAAIFALLACLAGAPALFGFERLRPSVTDSMTLSADSPAGSSVWVRPGDSVLIRLEEDARFFVGVEIRISAPSGWPSSPAGLALTVHADLDRVPPSGLSELVARRALSEALPSRVHTVFQIPTRGDHGLRTGPYSIVPGETVLPDSFPALFGLAHVSGVLSAELAGMSFLLSARPILAAEGAARVSVRFPENLVGRPFTVLVNDRVIENLAEEIVLREGEHHLAIVSQDYRNESRRFVVERARVVSIVIDLQDAAPMILFDAPPGAQVYLNDAPVAHENGPVVVAPGVHEARFHFGGHTITRVITVHSGRTYRVALTLDVGVEESD